MLPDQSAERVTRRTALRTLATKTGTVLALAAVPALAAACATEDPTLKASNFIEKQITPPRGYKFTDSKVAQANLEVVSQDTTNFHRAGSDFSALYYLPDALFANLKKSIIRRNPWDGTQEQVTVYTTPAGDVSGLVATYWNDDKRLLIVPDPVLQLPAKSVEIKTLADAALQINFDDAQGKEYQRTRQTWAKRVAESGNVVELAFRQPEPTSAVKQSRDELAQMIATIEPSIFVELAFHTLSQTQRLRRGRGVDSMLVPWHTLTLHENYGTKNLQGRPTGNPNIDRIMEKAVELSVAKGVSSSIGKIGDWDIITLGAIQHAMVSVLDPARSRWIEDKPLGKIPTTDELLPTNFVALSYRKASASDSEIMTRKTNIGYGNKLDRPYVIYVGPGSDDPEVAPIPTPIRLHR